jgi:hypothetical protein
MALLVFATFYQLMALLVFATFYQLMALLVFATFYQLMALLVFATFYQLMALLVFATFYQLMDLLVFATSVAFYQPRALIVFCDICTEFCQMVMASSYKLLSSVISDYSGKRQGRKVKFYRPLATAMCYRDVKKKGCNLKYVRTYSVEGPGKTTYTFSVTFRFLLPPPGRLACYQQAGETESSLALAENVYVILSTAFC